MSDRLDGREAVLARVAQANRLGGIYTAEAAGLLHALGLSTASGIYQDPAQQDAFLRGFRDGQEMLLIHAQVAKAVA